MIGKRGRPLRKAGVPVSVHACNENGDIVWEGICLSGNHGEFSIAVPSTASFFSFSIDREKRKTSLYSFLIIPYGKQGELSADYQEKIGKFLNKLSLSSKIISENERSYYYYEMRHEALNHYFSNKRIPKLADWFKSHSYFASAMRDSHRAVGWNGTSFSMWPPKKIEIGSNKYRVHDLYGNEYLSTVYKGGSFYRSSLDQTLVMKEFFPIYIKKEGAPRLFISQISSLVVLAGHNNASLVPDEREYIREYDPMMVFFK